MSSKSSEKSQSAINVKLPLLQLNKRLIYLPGITYRTIFNKSSDNILYKFKKQLLDDKVYKNLKMLREQHGSGDETDRLSTDCIEDIGLFNNVVDPGDNLNKLVVSCIPGFQYSDNDSGVDKVATVCKIVDIQEVHDSIVVSFKAVSRGLIIEESTDGQEAIFEIKLNEYEAIDDEIRKKCDFLCPLINELFENVESFINDYTEDRLAATETTTDGDQKDYEGISDARLKFVLLKLSPLSNLLYTQLSSNETSNGLARLEKLFHYFTTTEFENKQYNRFFQYSDVLIAIFPFSIAYKVEYLSSLQLAHRLESLEKCLNFSNSIFKNTLNVDYLLELWKNLDNKNGPSNGDILRSQFVSSHLRSLRSLVDEIGSNSGSRNGRPPATRRLTGGNGGSGSGAGAGSRASGTAAAEDDEDDDLKEITEFIKSIDDYVISEDGKRLIVKDFQRMTQMQSSSSDHQVLRTYIEIIMDLPWVKKTELGGLYSVNIDLKLAKTMLDKDHYGMSNVKERIIEYLAVLKLHDKINEANKLAFEKENGGNKEENELDQSFVMGEGNDNKPKSRRVVPKTRSAPKQSVAKAPIMLLTGPPGVGKTSLAKSIASTLGRKFQRISVGGLNDFADLKGHRRTYVGAIPGLIVQALRKSQSMNPVILLDEVDKIGSNNSRKGDPESALLEILDPEQNVSFNDHYIGFPIDLSQVLFICTSNDQWSLTEPLRDRMEVIELAGYNYFEKIEICQKYLVPRQIERSGLPPNSLIISNDTILKIALNYTREAGIRSLERFVGSICRSKAIEYSTDENNYNPVVELLDLPKYIGIPPHLSEFNAVAKEATKIQNDYGLVNGLSYNSDGSGSLLKFQMVGLPGSQNLICTGRLGEVLMESSQIANTLVGFILHSDLLSFSSKNEMTHDALIERYNNLLVHLHVPEGAISKDGPSAGITMTLCLLSLILQKPVASDLAMTGEITLTGKILPIGGVKEKLLGAHLTGEIKEVLLPRLNRKDIIEDYINSINDRVLANELLNKLIQEEEMALKTNSKDLFGEAEKWVKERLGIEIIYVSEFSEVVKIVWDNEVFIKGDENELKLVERSHL